jgi:enoyl-CoA hydratase
MTCCNIVVAGASARFGRPETNSGDLFRCGWHGYINATRRPNSCLEDGVDGPKPVGAEEARAIDLIAESAFDGEALDRALMLAAQLPGRAPLPLRAAEDSRREAAEQGEQDRSLAERHLFIRPLGAED